jgi:hypothetical protein
VIAFQPVFYFLYDYATPKFFFCVDCLQLKRKTVSPILIIFLSADVVVEIITSDKFEAVRGLSCIR